MHAHRCPARLTALAAATLLLGGTLAGCAQGDDPGDDAGRPAASTTTTPTAAAIDVTAVAAALELRPLSTSDDGAIVDDLGRQVLLRGVNITSLGEYWQGDPDHEPTMPTTEADWEAMAALGFSSVRLVISWSLLEPERGQIDEAYLDAIDEHVTAAADHGIHTVIDMHQDAYSAFISTPPGTTCAEGTAPAKGWDGAPEWATITDGLDTCLTGDRNGSPAVTAAWNHFYDDTDGIRTSFAAAWGAVAERFAGRPEVAGYDLLNEPDVSRPGAELTPLYDDLIGDVVTSIRDAEADAAFGHLLFVEPAIPAGHPMFGIVVPDPERIGLPATNVVAAPHNYAESIDLGGVSIEAMNELFASVASNLGVPLWLGEHGFWDTGVESLEELGRFAADQDRLVLGGAWWQWRQPCGDPHSVPYGGYEATGETNEQIHLNALRCPGDEPLGLTEPFAQVVGRGYPRAAPGRVTLLRTNPASGDLTIEGEGAHAGDELVVWTPTAGDTHDVVGDGMDGLEVLDVEGGRVIVATITADGPYALTVTER